MKCPVPSLRRNLRRVRELRLGCRVRVVEHPRECIGIAVAVEVREDVVDARPATLAAPPLEEAGLLGRVDERATAVLALPIHQQRVVPRTAGEVVDAGVVGHHEVGVAVEIEIDGDDLGAVLPTASPTSSVASR